ncbi:hypothetical protein [Bacillus pseudomycoides]|nr:hypothetical protein [Bacillus pseudomycoides]
MKSPNILAAVAGQIRKANEAPTVQQVKIHFRNGKFLRISI